MIANNIWRLIGDFFKWAFAPFDALRKGDLNWWQSNMVSWVFILILIVLLAYWISQAVGFKRGGVEDSKIPKS